MKNFVIVRSPSWFRIGFEFFVAKYLRTVARPVTFKVSDSDGRTVDMKVFLESVRRVGLSADVLEFSGYVFPGWGDVMPPSAGIDLSRARKVTGSFMSETGFGSLKMETRHLEHEREEESMLVS